MKRSTWVLLAIGALVVAEIWLLGFVGTRIGLGWLLLVLAGEAALGALLVRHEGAKAWRSLGEARAANPAELGAKVTDAALVLVGGVLLVMPGFVTDAVGLLFLVPATRGLARRMVGAVLSIVAKPYLDQADVLRARLERDTVVEGETVDPASGEPTRGPRPDDPTVIRGELG